MPHTITYSLKADQPHSDAFFSDLAAFTDEVLTAAETDLRPLVSAYQTFVERTGRETPRTWPEYLFELLTLGVLWRVYADRALHLPRGGQITLAALARLRETPLKPVVDVLRGVLATLFLARRKHGLPGGITPTPDHLSRLLDWLAATGDFGTEVERLRGWLAFWRDEGVSNRGQQAAPLPERPVSADLTAILTFAAWFEARSLAALGVYTPQVEHFLADVHPAYRWREDVIFCGRRRVEYHLNMVGTEILNRAFRADFLAAPRKVVFLPPCMRARSESACKAQPTPYGALCAGCTPSCRVHQVTQLGKKHGFAVFLLPDDLARASAGSAAQPGTAGIIGVSCPLTIIAGGWNCQDQGIPAQGLMLDYCGCPWHWDKDGFPTEINLKQLVRLVAE